MELLKTFLDYFLHLDKYLNSWATTMGGWLYVVLFGVLFAETGLVVTPFLPGDSLLFAVGALAALEGSPINIALVIVVMCVAAILGDATNYSIGKWVGPAAFKSDSSRLLNKKHLLRTQAFYEKHGGKTIVIARFMPIIRTFAPFVAGIGQMAYKRFALFNVSGGILWVCSVTLLGYAFGNAEPVKKNFHYVVVAIVVISVLPLIYEFIRERQRSRAEANKAS